MIIVNLAGGLGNQMFQYALGKAISLEKNTELLLHIKDTQNNQHNGYELKDVFGIQARIARQSDLKKVLGVRANPWIMRRMRSKHWLRGNCYFLEPHFHYTHSVFNIPDNTFIKGYWQSEKYFLKFKDEILRYFSFNNKNLSKENKNIIKEIKSHTSVSIHVRRGDYLSVKAHRVHGTMGVDYYKKAVSRFKTQLDHILYVLFTDDIGWVKNSFPSILGGGNYIIVDNNHGAQSYHDMMLMSLCKHNIIANSSFSWWGSYLNKNPNKKVIAPEKWLSAVDKNTSDLFPDSWISL